MPNGIKLVSRKPEVGEYVEFVRKYSLCEPGDLMECNYTGTNDYIDLTSHNYQIGMHDTSERPYVVLEGYKPE